jgi:clan AA aspartic protease
MITGLVTRQREAIVRLAVHGIGARKHSIRAVIDTGFDGWLSLPPTIIKLLRLPWHSRGRAVLADGSVCIFDIYNAEVVWDRRRVRVPVHEADADPLVGLALLQGYELRMQVRRNGRVIIDRLRT